MTTNEAIAFAATLKPLLPRLALAKSYGDAALAKLGSTVADMTKQLDWARDGIALVAAATAWKLKSNPETLQ
jgi:hypothetical protein